ncbi:MAG TPA: hypothetical protein PKY88_07900 [Anaerohalosphaeraceae bacterium]|nr:hypothetical protein [Anaerohalosphaeraceae bacterium]
MEKKQEQKSDGTVRLAPSAIRKVLAVYFGTALLLGTGILAAANRVAYHKQLSRASLLLQLASDAAQVEQYERCFELAAELTAKYPDYEPARKMLALRPQWEKDYQLLKEWRGILNIAQTGQTEKAALAAKVFLTQNPNSRLQSQVSSQLKIWEERIRADKIKTLLSEFLEALKKNDLEKAQAQIVLIGTLEPNYPQMDGLRRQVEEKKEALRIAREQEAKKAEFDRLLKEAAELEIKNLWKKALIRYEQAARVTFNPPDSGRAEILRKKLDGCRKTLEERQAAGEVLVQKARQAQIAGNLQQAVDFYRQAAAFTEQTYESEITALQKQIAAQSPPSETNEVNGNVVKNSNP